MAKKTAMIIGIILIIAGVWGLIQPLILGVFQNDVVSSIIHIVAGIILLAVMNRPAVTATLKTIGTIYVIFGIVGFIQGDSFLGIFAVNAVANVIYIILGVIMALAGWMQKKEVAAPVAPQM